LHLEYLAFVADAGLFIFFEQFGFGGCLADLVVADPHVGLVELAGGDVLMELHIVFDGFLVCAFGLEEVDVVTVADEGIGHHSVFADGAAGVHVPAVLLHLLGGVHVGGGQFVLVDGVQCVSPLELFP
jgi:hypothetical protein